MLYNNILIFIYTLLFFPISYFKGISINFKFIILSILSGFFFAVGIFLLVLVLKKKQLDNDNMAIVIPCKPKLEKNYSLIYNINIFYVFLLCFFF